MSEHEKDPAAPRVTDKRGQKKEPLPTAQELLDEGAALVDKARHVRTDTGDLTEFDHQRREAEEDARRAAAFDAMPEEEKQRILAEQAVADEPTPYSGGGIQTETEGQPTPIIACFAVIIHEDGTAVATDNMDVSGYASKFPVTSAMMHRACSEIMKDVQATDSAVQTVLLLKQSAEHSMAAARGAQLSQQLRKRGVRAPQR